MRSQGLAVQTKDHHPGFWSENEAENLPQRTHTMVPLPVQVRTEFGACRLCCDCDICKAACMYFPGHLLPSDLERLIPKDADPYVWAAAHLLANEGGLLKTQIKPDGSCHWFQRGKCEVWENSPFGCAFFACRKVQSQEEADRLRNAAKEVVFKALADKTSLYRRLWDYLWSVGHRRTRADMVLSQERYANWLQRGQCLP
jgi:hypothetical protein